MKLGTFTRTEKFIPETLGNKDLPDAEKFYVTINTLELTDQFVVNAVMLRARRLNEEALKLPEGTVERALVQQEGAEVVIKGFSDVATKYVEVHNLNDSDGNPISIEDFAKYAVFAETVIEIMTHILGLSTPNEDDTKNS